MRFALDISQNLDCYEWKPRGAPREIAEREIMGYGVMEEVIAAGCIDLDEYGAALLEAAGYVMTEDDSGFVGRNNREFVYERSEPRSGQAQTMQ